MLRIWIGCPVILSYSVGRAFGPGELNRESHDGCQIARLPVPKEISLNVTDELKVLRQVDKGN